MPRSRLGEGKSRQIHAYVTEELYDDIQGLVGNGGFMSMAEIVRHALQKLLEDENLGKSSEPSDIDTSDDELSNYIWTGSYYVRVGDRWLKKYNLKLGELLEDLMNSPMRHDELEAKWKTRIEISHGDPPKATWNQPDAIGE